MPLVKHTQQEYAGWTVFWLLVLYCHHSLLFLLFVLHIHIRQWQQKREKRIKYKGKSNNFKRCANKFIHKYLIFMLCFKYRHTHTHRPTTTCNTIIFYFTHNQLTRRDMSYLLVVVRVCGRVVEEQMQNKWNEEIKNQPPACICFCVVCRWNEDRVN